MEDKEKRQPLGLPFQWAVRMRYAPTVSSTLTATGVSQL